MPVVVIVILVVIALGGTAAVVVPVLVADPVPPAPPPPTELRAPELPGVAIDSTRVAAPRYVPPFVEEAPLPREAPADTNAESQEANPYDAILDDGWRPDGSGELEGSFEPDPDPIIEARPSTGGLAGRLGGV